MAKYNSIVYMCHIFFSHSPVHVHLIEIVQGYRYARISGIVT